MLLGAGTSISKENIWSTHAEHTSFGVENDSPEGSVDGADTLSSTSRVPLGLWCSMATAIDGPKTDYVERDRSWRWSGEPE